MTDKISITVSCATCGESPSSQWCDESNSVSTCPNCGGSAKIISMRIEETLDVRESLRVKLKDPSLPSDEKTRVEVFYGDDLRKSDNQWMKKERIIDRMNDHYKEVVTDLKTGKVIHYNEELLSKHFGHGSAKLKS